VARLNKAVRTALLVKSRESALRSAAADYFEAVEAAEEMLLQPGAAQFCAICLAPARDSTDLQRSVEDDRLECRRCRYLHPRSGAYNFGDNGRGDGVPGIATMKRRGKGGAE
jgi:hypothetical protein